MQAGNNFGGNRFRLRHAVLGILELRRVFREMAESRNDAAAGAERSNPVRWLAGLIGLAYATWVYLAALLPPTGIDELTYHLEVPRRILAEGGAVFFVDNVRAYFPQLAEYMGRGLAAGLAVQAAEKLLTKNLDDPTQRKLVEDYLADLERSGGADSLPS